MKFLIFCLLAMDSSASVFKTPKGENQLHRNLENFIEVIPFEKFVGIVEGYIENNDTEVTQLVEFIKSGKPQDLATQIYYMPEVQAQINELNTKGIHIVEIYNFTVNTATRKIPEKIIVIEAKSKGIVGMYNQMINELPVIELLSAAIVLMKSNEELVILLEQLRSKAAIEAAKKVLEGKEVNEDLNKLREAGVDVEALKNFTLGAVEMLMS